MSEIQTNYRCYQDPFFGDCLLDTFGSIHQKHLYRTDLEKSLSEKLLNPQRAHEIVELFKTHVYPHLSDEERSEWARCLDENGYVLGGSRSHLKKIFSEFSTVTCNTFLDHPEAIDAFIQALATKPKSLKSRKIVILTSSSGGGHITTAEAVKKIWEAKGYKAVILNQDELVRRKQIDALQLAGAHYKGDALTTAEVYNRVAQQDNNWDAARELWHDHAGKVRDYVPNQEMALVAEEIRKINPEKIISVATHHPEHAALAHATNIPLSYVHTDFDFNDALIPIVDKVDPKLVDFWVNAPDKEILKTDKLKQLAIQGRIRVCGYPVRGAFKRPKAEEVMKIREELGLKEDEKVAILAMGRQGIAEHILKYIRLLADPKNGIKTPLFIPVICGKNAALKEEVTNLLKSLSEINPFVRFSVQGFVGEEQMASYFKVASALISKPGGATAAEAAAMGVPMLSCRDDAHSWEIPNERYLMRHKLAEHLEGDDSFVGQLLGVLSLKSDYIPLKWQTAMARMVSGTPAA